HTWRAGRRPRLADAREAGAVARAEVSVVARIAVARSGADALAVALRALAVEAGAGAHVGAAGARRLVGRGMRPVGDARHVSLGAPRDRQIGRASCRERVGMSGG